MFNLPVETMKLTASEDSVEGYRRLRRAVFHLAECWDELHEAQWLLTDVLDIEHVADLASNISDGGEAFLISDESLAALLRQVKSGTYVSHQ